jgi:hypothetical protein
LCRYPDCPSALNPLFVGGAVFSVATATPTAPQALNGYAEHALSAVVKKRRNMFAPGMRRWYGQAHRSNVMRSIAFIGQIVLGFTLATALHGQTASDLPKPKIIPLKDIWAYEMPGTRDVWELEPDKFGVKVRDLSSQEQSKRYKESLIFQIRNHFGMPKSQQMALPGFAVLGSGMDALRNAHAVLVKGKQPRKAFPENSAVSIVFFSKVFDYYVHLEKVEKQGNTITIKYFFVPHRGDGTAHFALIPLGKMPVGEIKVDAVRSPLPKMSDVAGFGAPPSTALDSIVVCRPFSFKVERATTK